MEPQTQNLMKQQAAIYAVDTYFKSGMTLGLGTGSTSEYAVRHLADLYNSEQIANITCVATSDHISGLAKLLNLPVTTLDNVNTIDVTIDGADEVEPKSFYLIKGKGGALLREKLVAAASQMEVIIADETKLVQQLGEHNPVPVEVIAFGWAQTAMRLRMIGAEPTLRLLPSELNKPFVTDSGNYILDCHFATITDPVTTANLIKNIIGVVEHGIFINLVHRVIIGGNQAVYEVTR